MLVPSTARLYTGSSERPHGEGIHAMLQGQRPAWQRKHDRLQS